MQPYSHIKLCKLWCCRIGRKNLRGRVDPLKRTLKKAARREARREIERDRHG